MPKVAEIFQEMPNRFNAEKAGDIDAVIFFDLSGDNGGQWAVQIADGACESVEGVPDDPTATLKMDGDDYVNMALGKLNPMTAFMTGKVKVEGDLSVIMKFQGLFG